MSLVASIEIKFYQPPLISDVLSTLLDFGWGFYNGTITFEHYRDSIDMGEYQTVPAQEWAALRNILDENTQLGETVGLFLYWHGHGVLINPVFDLDKHLRIFFDGSRPTLGPNSRFTDYTWLLLRIVIPLSDAGYEIKMVECNDENS